MGAVFGLKASCIDSGLEDLRGWSMVMACWMGPDVSVFFTFLVGVLVTKKEEMVQYTNTFL